MQSASTANQYYGDAYGYGSAVGVPPSGTGSATAASSPSSAGGDNKVRVRTGQRGPQPSVEKLA